MGETKSTAARTNEQILEDFLYTKEIKQTDYDQLTQIADPLKRLRIEGYADSLSHTFIGMFDAKYKLFSKITNSENNKDKIINKFNELLKGNAAKGIIANPKKALGFIYTVLKYGKDSDNLKFGAGANDSFKKIIDEELGIKEGVKTEKTDEPKTDIDTDSMGKDGFTLAQVMQMTPNSTIDPASDFAVLNNKRMAERRDVTRPPVKGATDNYTKIVKQREIQSHKIKKEYEEFIAHYTAEEQQFALKTGLFTWPKTPKSVGRKYKATKTLIIRKYNDDQKIYVHLLAESYTFDPEQQKKQGPAVSIVPPVKTPQQQPQQQPPAPQPPAQQPPAQQPPPAAPGAPAGTSGTTTSTPASTAGGTTGTTTPAVVITPGGSQKPDKPKPTGSIKPADEAQKNKDIVKVTLTPINQPPYYAGQSIKFKVKIEGKIPKKQPFELCIKTDKSSIILHSEDLKRGKRGFNIDVIMPEAGAHTCQAILKYDENLKKEATSEILNFKVGPQPNK